MSVSSQPPEVSPDPGHGSTVRLPMGDNQSGRVQLQGQGQPAPRSTLLGYRATTVSTIPTLQAQQQPVPGQDSTVPPTPTFEKQPQPQSISQYTDQHHQGLGTIVGGASNQSVPISEPNPQPAQQQTVISGPA